LKRVANVFRRFHMLCGDLAHALRDYGIRVASTCDGDNDEDGEVTVGANVHVRVPTFGEAPRVVVDPFHGDFRCYPPRESVAELAADIRCALDEVPSMVAMSSLH